jgi:EAL domain-containing protein (putative c-di-GMP-specific phosphodiesterase class I)
VRAANCDAAQGFLLARPMPAAEAREYLTRSVPETAGRR